MTHVERLLGAEKAMNLTLRGIEKMVDESPTAGEGYTPAGGCQSYLETLTIGKGVVYMWFNDAQGSTSLVSVVI
jgi:hypothetical protein